MQNPFFSFFHSFQENKPDMMNQKSNEGTFLSIFKALM